MVRQLRGFTIAFRHTIEVGLLWTSDHPDAPDNTQQSEQTNIHAPVGFEPTIPVSERPQTHALDGAVTGIGS
jgi:hypothetical protein